MNCEKGIVSVTEIPNLTIGKKFTVETTAKPDSNLRIRVRSSNKGDTVNPNFLRFGSGLETQSFTITPYKTGFISVTYTLSGRNKRDFLDVPVSSFFVKDAASSPTRYFEQIASPIGHLVEGCCVDMDQEDIGRCGTKVVQLRSGCRWHEHESPGVIFLTSNGFSLPFSIGGASAKNGDIMLPSQINNCDSCSDVSSSSQPSQQCSNSDHYEFTAGNILSFLAVRALPLTYLSTIQPLLPGWVSNLTIDLDLVNNGTQTFASYDYKTDLVPRGEVATLQGCENLAPSVGNYSVLRYGRTITATLDSQVLQFPDPMSVGTPMCFAINFCQGTSSPLHIGLSPEIENIIVSEFLREYTDRGWEITVPSVVLSREGQAIQHGITEEYWNGITLSTPLLSLPETFDLSMNASIGASFQSSHLSVQLELSGKLHCKYQVGSNVTTQVTS